MRKILLLFVIFLFISFVNAGVIIRSPSNNAEIVNTLSFTLNVSNSGGFNSTINYSWNNGIKNYTLCQNCTINNWTTISMIRQGSYNISVYAFDSSGNMQTNISSIFVGNSTNFTDIEDLYMISTSSHYASAIKFNITDFNKSKNIFKTFVSLFINYYSNSDSDILYKRISNQTWKESTFDISKVELVNTTSNELLSSITDSTWTYLNTTNIVKTDVILENNFTSIFFEDLDHTLTSSINYQNTGSLEIGDSSDILSFDSSEGTNKPYLKILYSDLNNILTLTNILSNNSNFSTSIVNFTFNISDDNDYIKNASIYIDGLLNATSYINYPINVGNNSLNFSVNNIPDGTHYWFIKACDSDDSCTDSDNFTFTIDTTPPNLIIYSPTQSETFITTSVPLNFSVIDNGILSTCWYKNDTGVNITIPCDQNLTFTQSAGTHHLYFWVNDTLNNINYTDITYQIVIGPPSINLVYPSNNLWLRNGSIDFNFTAQDSNGLGIKNCSLYGNWTGNWELNQSNSTLMNGAGIFNYNFKNNLSDGYFSWNIFCYEKNGLQSGWALNNYSLGVDTIYPSIFVLPSTIQGSQTISFDITSSDTNLNSCKYSIFNSSGGIDGIYNNISVSCNSLGNTPTVSSFSNYNITVYAKDLAGNENSSTKTFTTIATTIVPTSGGGGGGPNKISTVAIINPSNETRTELERAIFYALFRNYCNNETNCKLNDSSKDAIMDILSSYDIIIFESSLNKFLEGYNNNELESVQMSEPNVNKYNLFTGVLSVISTGFKIVPSRLDPFFAIVLFSNNFTYELKANRVLNNVSMNGELGLTAEKGSDSTILVNLNVIDKNFIAKTFLGNIEAIDKDGNSVFVPVSIRTINLSNPFTIFLSIVLLSLIILGVSFRGKIKDYSKRIFK